VGLFLPFKSFLEEKQSSEKYPLKSPKEFSISGSHRTKRGGYLLFLKVLEKKQSIKKYPLKSLKEFFTS